MGWKKGQAVQLLPFSEASGRVLEVYRDVQSVFGVPHISSFFQYLGTQPRFLERYWNAVRPVAATEEFFSCAQRLRGNAYNRVNTYFEVADLKCEVNRQQFSPGACEELRDCINFFHHSVPMSLLLAATLSQALTGSAGNPEVHRTPAVPHKPHRRIIMVEEDSSSPAVKAIFADIRSVTGADVVHTVYRAFARWPDFLKSYWELVKPLTVSALFQHSELAVVEDAAQITQELPGPVAFTTSDFSASGMNETEAGSLTRITEMFVHSLSAALLNVSIARIAMDGGNLHGNAAQPKEAVPLP
jgi:hypothetical protein